MSTKAENCNKKRKKTKSKKSTLSHLQQWVDETSNHNGDIYDMNFSSIPNYTPFWYNQRLYQNMTDPTPCNYPYRMQMRYPMEPVSLPVYPQQVWPRTSEKVPILKPKITTSSDSVYSSKNNDSVQNQDYTSLPPVMDHLSVEGESKRRFSDPGIGPLSTESGDESSECGSVGNKDSEVMCMLVEQVNVLKESNRKMYRELQETKMELGLLKQQASAWTRSDRTYEPGILSEIVRDIRDAAKAREDALLTRVRHMIEEVNFNRNYLTTSYSTTSRDYEELKNQLKSACVENHRTNVRLGKIEKQLQDIKIDNNKQEELTPADVSLTKSVDFDISARRRRFSSRSFFKLISRKVFKSEGSERGPPPKSDSGDSLSQNEHVPEPGTEPELLPEPGIEPELLPEPGLDLDLVMEPGLEQKLEVFPGLEIVEISADEKAVDTSDSGVPVLHSPGGSSSGAAAVATAGYSPPSDHLVELEQETLKLRRELQVARDARRMCPSYISDPVQKTRQSPHVVSTTVPESSSALGAVGTPGSGAVESASQLKHSDSITSFETVSSNSPMHYVTLSGPVTDL